MERPSLVLLSAYQEYLMTFKLMTSQVVQRARPLITHICVIRAQRIHFYWNERKITVLFAFAHHSQCPCVIFDPVGNGNGIQKTVAYKAPSLISSSG